MAETILNVIERFFWSLGQAVFVGYPLGTAVVAALSVIALVVSANAMPRAKAARKPLLILAILPACWVFLAFWGAIFYFDWDSGKPQNPAWIGWTVYAVLGFFILSWVVFLFRLKGARLVTAIFGLWNLYFVLFMALIAIMSVSGNWM